MTRTLSTLARLLLLPMTASAAPLDPWGAAVEKGVVAVTPFVFVDQSPTIYPSIYGQIGLTDSVELLAGVGGALGSESGFDRVEVTPRTFLSEASAAVLHLTWVPESGWTVAPEYHGVYAMDAIDLTVNTGWGPTFGPGGFQPGTVYAFIAPERYLTDATSVFLEFNPSYDLGEDLGGPGDRITVDLVPGVSTGIADTHYFSVGVGVPVTGFDPGGIYLGLWYSISLGGDPGASTVGRQAYSTRSQSRG